MGEKFNEQLRISYAPIICVERVEKIVLEDHK
jgi:hypothetical protein